MTKCQVPPSGWWCSRTPGHDGPCAARQKWWHKVLRWIQWEYYMRK